MDEQLLEDVVTLKLRGDAWESYAKALSDLCVAYRMQRYPSDRVLNAVENSRQLLIDLGESL
ncbi:MAG: hypothetical protein AMXMBFR16_10570 [Candidatus Uhrbacteria bacterium]